MGQNSLNNSAETSQVSPSGVPELTASVAVEPSSRKTLVIKTLLLAGLAMPCVLSLVASARGPLPTMMIEAAPLPALTFNQYYVDLREVPASPEVYAHFAFRNSSKRPVRITKLVPSCGCLQPQMKKWAYAPEEVGEFLLRVQTANQSPGPKEYRVTVHYEDPLPRQRDVVFKVTLPESQVIVRPPAIMVFQPSEQSIEQDVTVSDYRASTLDLLGTECSSEFVTAEILEADDASSPDRRVRVTIRGNVPPGRHQTLLTIFTTDEKYHKIQVPIRIQGPQEASAVATQPREIGPALK